MPEPLTEGDEREFVEAMREIADCRLDLKLSAVEVNCLFANLQLALRHPANIGASSELTRHIAKRLYGWLTNQAPALKRGLEAGWNEAHDYVAKADETRIVISVLRAQRAIETAIQDFFETQSLSLRSEMRERLAEAVTEVLLAEATKGNHASR
jgi:hypothetical protein